MACSGQLHFFYNAISWILFYFWILSWKLFFSKTWNFCVTEQTFLSEGSSFEIPSSVLGCMWPWARSLSRLHLLRIIELDRRQPCRHSSILRYGKLLTNNHQQLLTFLLLHPLLSSSYSPVPLIIISFQLEYWKFIPVSLRPVVMYF
jgi:hypothetical protein